MTILVFCVCVCVCVCVNVFSGRRPRKTGDGSSSCSSPSPHVAISFFLRSLHMPNLFSALYTFLKSLFKVPVKCMPCCVIKVVQSLCSVNQCDCTGRWLICLEMSSRHTDLHFRQMSTKTSMEKISQPIAIEHQAWFLMGLNVCRAPKVVPCCSGSILTSN